MFRGISEKEYLTERVVSALYKELNLTPKPGLVDRMGAGAHEDMNYTLMASAIDALAPYFSEMVEISEKKEPSAFLRQRLAQIGRRAERAMYQVTGGVNTHKGAIWSLGLLASAAAMNRAGKYEPSICETAAAIARWEDPSYTPKTLTHGQQVKTRYGVGGALAEAQAGFPHIRRYALPMLHSSRSRGESETEAQMNALLSLMAHLMDTCLLYRCGEEGAAQIRRLCAQILEQGGYAQPQGRRLFYDLHQQMAQMGASPGGSADLLAATLFLDDIKKYGIPSEGVL